MPIQKIETLNDGCRIALWKMTESISDLPRPQKVSFSNIHSEVRIREKLVEYRMLYELTSRDDLVINHLQSGKPFINGYSISLSHTKGWAAMIVSIKPMILGIDIEYVSDRVNKVAERFIRSDEQSGTLAHRLINWSAKETVYKALSEENLDYFEMRLLPFYLPVFTTDNHEARGTVMVDDLKQTKRLQVSYFLNSEFVLTSCHCTSLF